MRQVWVCDKCDRTHATEAGAVACEATHGDATKARIVSGAFTPVRGVPSHVPKHLVVRFSDAYGDLGSYELQFYGMKGI